MSTDKDEKDCFVLIRGKRYGPYSFATLEKAAEKGDIDPQSGVWCSGWPQWRVAREVAGLFGEQPESVVPHEPKESSAHRDEPDDNAGRQAGLSEAESAADRSIGPNYRQELAAKLGQAPPLALWPPPPKFVPPPPKFVPPRNVRAKVRIVVLFSLAALVVVIGATWVAASLGVIVVEFLPQRP